jgi:hypothetical protein
VIALQRHELPWHPGNLALRKRPAEILVGGVSLTESEAGELTHLLTEARFLVETSN